VAVVRRVAAVVALALLALAGCADDEAGGPSGGELRTEGTTSSSTTTTTTRAGVPDPSDDERPGEPRGDHVVLDVRSHGGLCETGECWHSWTVRADGTWSTESWDQEPSTGTIDTAAIDAMLDAFAARPVGPGDLPPAGSCPTAFDGTEEILTVTVEPGEPLTFSTCDVAIPGGESPFTEMFDLFRVVAQASDDDPQG
jgi:hypothetical protein